MWAVIGWHVLVSFAGWRAEKESQKEAKANATKVSTETPEAGQSASETPQSDKPHVTCP